MSAIKATLSRSGSRNRRILAVLIGLCVAGVTVAAWAYWTPGTSAGSGASKGGSVNQGATPTASAVGRKVTVSWGASTLSTGGAVDGYIVKRYDANTDALQTVLNDCSGTITALTCDERLVPAGDWKYTVTPKFADNWTGPESAKSGTVTVDATKSVTLDKTLFGTADFTGGNATVTGSLVNFDPNETLSFKLDDATSGTDLSGTPAAADSDGNASISVTLPQPSDGAHTIYALGGNGSQVSAGIVVDTTAPSVTPSVSPTPNAGGWNNTSPVSVTLTPDDGTGSGVKFVKYTTDGSDPTTSGTAQTYTAPISVSDNNTTVKFFAEDNAGNDSSVASQLIKIDTTAPTFGSPGVTIGKTGTNTFVSGTTVYTNPQTGNSGTFTVTPSVSDAESGIAKANYPDLGTGYTTGSGDVNSSPFASTYTWSGATATASGSQTVTGYNNADLSATTSFTVTPDTTAPTGAAAPTITGGYYTNTTGIAVTRNSTPADSGSGVASNQLQREVGTLSNGGCDFSTATWTSVTLHSGVDSSPPSNQIQTGKCYQYRDLITDNVGNQTASAASDVAKVDTSAPVFGSPALTITPHGSSTSATGSTVYYNPQSTNTGSFDVTASVTDDSGIQKVNFPSITNFGSGGDVTSSPYTSTYSWDASNATATGAQTVTAFNNSGGGTNSGSATTTFTLTQDTTGPTGGALTVNGTAASGAGTTSATTSTSIAIGTRTNYGADAGSGVASSVLTRQDASISNGTCQTFGSPTTISGTTTQSSLSTGCYKFTLTGTDNVGNASSISTIVKLDTSGPVFGTPPVTLTANNGQAFVNGQTVYVNSSPGSTASFGVSENVSDTDSGIASGTFPTIGGLTGGGAVSSSTPSTTYTRNTNTFTGGSQNVSAANTAGGSTTSTGAFTVTPDATAPTGGALTVNGTAATGAGSSSLNSSGTFTIGTRSDYNADTGSGVGSSTLTVASTTYTNSTGACGTTFGTPTTISGNPDQTGLSEGCYKYTLTGTDNVGNTTTISTVVAVDKTAPTVSLATTNGGGNNKAGIPEKSDTLALTFSEAIQPSTICSGWTGTTFSATPTITLNDGTGATNDSLTVTVASGCTTFRFGTVDLGSNAYVSGGSATFSGTGAGLAYNSSTHILTLTLGTKAGTGTITSTAITSSVITYTQPSGITDLAGNALATGFTTGTVQQF